MFVLLLIVVLVEVRLSGTWNESYFRKGAILYRKTFDFAGLSIDGSSIEAVEKHSRDSIWPSFLFRSIGTNVYAFREDLLDRPFSKFSYLPIMHGTIRLIHDRPAIVVTGLGNWYFLALLMLLIYVALSSNDSLSLIGSVPVFLLCYAGQAARFFRLGRMVSEPERQDSGG